MVAAYTVKLTLGELVKLNPKPPLPPPLNVIPPSTGTEAVLVVTEAEKARLSIATSWAPPAGFWDSQTSHKVEFVVQPVMAMLLVAKST